MKRFVLIGAAALFLSMAVIIAGTPGSLQHFKFKIGNYDINGETAAIKDSIRLFSATIAGFYSTGGNPAGLNMFPAEQMIKRRIFMDISYNQKAGKVLVMDRDKSSYRQVLFAGPMHAVAVVDEDWFSVYRDYNTRKPISDKKANLITIRYLLKKMWGRWIVVEYEVYGRKDTIATLPVKNFIRW